MPQSATKVFTQALATAPIRRNAHPILTHGTQTWCERAGVTRICLDGVAKAWFSVEVSSLSQGYTVIRECRQRPALLYS